MLDLASLGALITAAILGAHLTLSRARKAAAFVLLVLSAVVIGAQVYATPCETTPSALTVRVASPQGVKVLEGRTTVRDWSLLEVVWPLEKMTQIEYDFDKGANPRCTFPEYRAYTGPRESVEFVLGNVTPGELSDVGIEFCAWVADDRLHVKYGVDGVVTELPDGSTHFSVRYWKVDVKREFSATLIVVASSLSATVAAALVAWWNRNEE